MGFLRLGRLLSLGRTLMRRGGHWNRYSLPDQERYVPRVQSFEQHALDGEFLRDLRFRNGGGNLESRTSKTPRKS